MADPMGDIMVCHGFGLYKKRPDNGSHNRHLVKGLLLTYKMLANTSGQDSAAAWSSSELIDTQPRDMVVLG